MRYFLLLLTLYVLLPTTGQAQREYYNWYFGNAAGITFNAGAPAFLPGNQHEQPYSPFTVSDGAGVVQLSGEDTDVWSRSGTAIPGNVPGNCPIGLDHNISAVTLAVPQPGRPGRYYIFHLVSRADGPNLCSITYRYLVVDMQKQGGTGEVVEIDALPGMPSVGGAYSALAAVRHANGRDLWIVAQGSDSRCYAWLLTPAGWQGPPVVSGSPATNEYFNLLQLFKASPDGRYLAAARVRQAAATQPGYTHLELAEFSSSKGTITQFRTLPDSLRGTRRNIPYPGGVMASAVCRIGGLEFSPDGSRLYADTVGGHEIWQYNLLAGSPAAIAASKQRIPVTTDGELNDLQLGPDGNIYVSAWNSPYLARLTNTNASATGVRYEPRAVDLQGATCQFALPRSPNDLNLLPVQITSSGTVSASVATTCAGESVLFQSSLSPFVTAASYAWDFGDPSAGSANHTAGQAPSHTYTQAGTYAVRLRVTASNGQVFETGQTVQVLPQPRVAWPADTTLCAGEQHVLSLGPQPAGTTYRWQDGSTTSSVAVTRAGSYSVLVTGPNGCSRPAQLTVRFADCPSELPNVLTPADGNLANDFFELKGLNASEWSLRIFNRWGREVFYQQQYDNRWSAAGQSPGIYYYLLYKPSTNQRLRGWVEVVK